MGIQPIDLQTMYSQLSTVSKTMAAGQQSQLTEAMQQQNNIQRSLENSTKVQQTQTDKTDANSVNKDGRGGSAAFGGKKNNRQNAEDNAEKSSDGQGETKSGSPYIGTIIDITR
ncbi:MAG: hypothetical protein K6C98_00850 [Treponema sp.]|nr:hypothetical protein [Treponema sp.]